MESEVRTDPPVEPDPGQPTAPGTEPDGTDEGGDAADNEGVEDDEDE